MDLTASHFQPGIIPIRINVAGLSIGFANQYASVALVDAPLRLNPTATGAAQHVHIIDGIAIRVAVLTPRYPFPPSNQPYQSRGTTASTPVPKIKPSTRAFQMSRAYAHA